MGVLYENIVSLCEERNIKPGKMCNEIGISRSILTDLKTGRKKSINAITAQRIADYFGVPVGQVLNGPETEQKNKPTPKNESGQGLPAGYDKLTPENKAIVDRLIVDLANNQSKH